MPAPAFLPGADERSRPVVVHDRRTRADERELPTCTLGAARNRPWPRRPTPLAHGRSEPDERRPASRTKRPAGALADRAPLRQEQVEQAHTGHARRTRVTSSCRLRVEFRPHAASGRGRGRAVRSLNPLRRWADPRRASSRAPVPAPHARRSSGARRDGSACTARAASSRCASPRRCRPSRPPEGGSTP